MSLKCLSVAKTMPLVECEWVGQKNNIVVIYLNNKPVNIFTLPFLREFQSVLEQFKLNRKCKGVIILSKFGKKRNVWSAGFDLSLFAKNDRNLSAKYLNALISVLLSIHTLGKPIIMGINGKNIAGGAVVAMTGDYRIMKKDATLHYIEAQFGLGIVQVIFDSVQRVVSRDIASYVFQTAIPFNAQKSLQLGLVNEICDNDQELLKRSIIVLEKEYFNASIEAANAARTLGRKYYINYLQNNELVKQNVQGLLDQFHSHAVQKYIKNYLSVATKKRRRKSSTAKL